MKRFLTIAALALTLVGCRDTEARLPRPGEIVQNRETGDMFQVTWSGTTTYNLGACEVNQRCVHLVRTVNTDNRVEIAVTLQEFGDAYRRVSDDR